MYNINIKVNLEFHNENTICYGIFTLSKGFEQASSGTIAPSAMTARYWEERGYGILCQNIAAQRSRNSVLHGNFKYEVIVAWQMNTTVYFQSVDVILAIIRQNSKIYTIFVYFWITFPNPSIFFGL